MDTKVFLIQLLSCIDSFEIQLKSTSRPDMIQDMMIDLEKALELGKLYKILKVAAIFGNTKHDGYIADVYTIVTIGEIELYRGFKVELWDSKLTYSLKESYGKVL